MFDQKRLMISLAMVFLGVGLIHFAATSTPAQQPPQFVARLTAVRGSVQVDGQAASNGDSIASGSTVETAARSSAVVSLGKLGRVEVQEETRLKLTYDSSNCAILLYAGNVEVSKGRDTTCTITRSP